MFDFAFTYFLCGCFHGSITAVYSTDQIVRIRTSYSTVSSGHELHSDKAAIATNVLLCESNAGIQGITVKKKTPACVNNQLPSLQ